MANTDATTNGIISAVLTPFREDGSVDMEALGVQMKYLLDAGIDGFMVGGTTSEGAYLTAEERKEIIRLAKDLSQGKRSLVVAALRPPTEQVIAELDHLLPLQRDFVAALTPYYYAVSQAAVLEHYTRIADHVSVPMILYNIPQNTHNRIELDTILRLAEHPNIVGIKDSSGDFMSVSRGMIRTNDNRFAWIQGEDILDAPSLLYGAKGVITGLGNVWIEPYVRMYRAVLEGDRETVITEQKKINAVAEIIAVAGGAVIPAIKMAVSILGRANERMRITGDTLPAAVRPKIEAVLKKVGLV